MSDYSIDPLQAAWLMLEDSATPMHIGGLLYFKRPKGAKVDYVQQFAASWRAQTEFASPWNCRLRKVPGLGRPPVLTEAKSLDLDYHFRHSALPAPGGERQIGELVSRLHSHPMDMSKPLWEVHLIEGLHGDRFAVYIKLHSVIFDSAATLTILRNTLGVNPRQRDMPAFWSIPLPPRKTSQHILQEWPALLRAVGGRLQGRLSWRKPWRATPKAPRSALNDSINAQRRFATQVYAVERLHAVAKPLGASVDELLLYLCSSALRRFFKEYNALPDQSMVALVADRSRGDGMLNPLFVRLATHTANRGKRLDEIRRSLTSARRQFAVLPPADARAEGTLDALPYLLRQTVGVNAHWRPLFNLAIAQMSLGDDTRYLNGAALESMFPMPMLLQGGALNIALLRYDQHWHVGLCGARDNLPHLQRMAVYMGAALEELEEAIASE